MDKLVTFFFEPSRQTKAKQDKVIKWVMVIGVGYYIGHFIAYLLKGVF